MVIIIALLILIALIVLVSFYFYSVAFSRRNKLMASSDEWWKQLKTPSADGVRWFNEQNFQDLYVTSVDKLKLHAYYLEQQKKASKTVIVVHGYRCEPKDMGIYAKIFYNAGYNLLIPDLRSHGKSEGKTITFGWKERLDLKEWIHIALDKAGYNCEIILHGLSMGAATVMMTSGEELPENVRCIIADCGYSCLKEQLLHVMKTRFHLPKFPLIYTISLLMRIRQGYFLKAVSSVNQIKKTSIPMFFIHGEKDNFVPLRMLSIVYDACKVSKKIMRVPEAGHAEAIDMDKDKYEKEVMEFIETA